MEKVLKLSLKKRLRKNKKSLMKKKMSRRSKKKNWTKKIVRMKKKENLKRRRENLKKKNLQNKYNRVVLSIDVGVGICISTGIV